MKHVIIGTAGHVDHGKSAIIKALTGIDTDRLKEEKQRGISIDLGFASLPLGDKIIAGVVDVPGHEHFLKNMLAGTGGIDLAMLVIAADEGVMPQTQEHLAMLELYGIKYGLVVINKIDKVDQEWLGLIEGEIQEYISKTFLKNAPVCRVSAATGAGIDELKTALIKLADSIPARDSSSPFRLWIDRVFTIKGHGVVVTGSVLSGRAKSGDSVQLYPADSVVRIRGLERHGEKVNEIMAGQRAAINLAGVDMEDVSRGMVLSAPKRGEVSAAWDIVGDWREEIESGLRVRLHLGTGEFLGRIYSFKDTDNKYMRLILEEPLAAGTGDRGIIRLYSPQQLLGGVTLIAPGHNTRRLKPERAALADAVAKNEGTEVLYHRLRETQRMQAQDEIKRLSGYLPDKVVDQAVNKLMAAKKLQCFDKLYIVSSIVERLTHKMTTALREYHKSQPDKGGLTKEIIRQKLAVDEKSFDTLLTQWLQDNKVTINGGLLALRSHAERHGGWQQDIIAKAEVALAQAGLTNVDQGYLAERLTLPPEKAKPAHEALVRAGVLLKLGDMYVYRKTMQYIVQLIHKHFQEKETLTVGELRDILNTSRKVALPVMEYLDMNKYTIRDGDVRRASRKIQDLSE